LEDRFGRWRFLQRLLDGEVSGHDASELLVAVLRKSLAVSRTKEGSEGSVELSLEQRNRLQAFLDQMDDGEGNASLFEEGQLVLDPSKADQLAALLPNMDSDEDAYKGLWDTVIEIHGREAVKIDEASRSPTWTACCLTARLLIHYDFLAEGV
jgi:hypothetical protein